MPRKKKTAPIPQMQQPNPKPSKGYRKYVRQSTVDTANTLLNNINFDLNRLNDQHKQIIRKQPVKKSTTAGINAELNRQITRGRIKNDIKKLDQEKKACVVERKKAVAQVKKCDDEQRKIRNARARLARTEKGYVPRKKVKKTA